MHLLSRLLAFDPERRCTAEEALQHEYFVGLETAEPDTGKRQPCKLVEAWRRDSPCFVRSAPGFFFAKRVAAFPGTSACAF